MKKFKRIFYLAYLLFFCFAGFIALNYEDIVLKWDWDFIDTWAGLLRFVLKLGGFGLILFFTEIVVENIHVYTLTKKIRSLENDVLDLKSKLYDQGNNKEEESVANENTDASEDDTKEEQSEE